MILLQPIKRVDIRVNVYKFFRLVILIIGNIGGKFLALLLCLLKLV